MTTTEMRTDIRIEYHGSVALIRPLTVTGQEWVEENVAAESWQWFGGAVASEPRMVARVADGAREDGLTVEDN